jgi:hypothetical protein
MIEERRAAAGYASSCSIFSQMSILWIRKGVELWLLLPAGGAVEDARCPYRIQTPMQIRTPVLSPI